MLMGPLAATDSGRIVAVVTCNSGPVIDGRAGTRQGWQLLLLGGL